MLWFTMIILTVFAPLLSLASLHFDWLWQGPSLKGPKLEIFVVVSTSRLNCPPPTSTMRGTTPQPPGGTGLCMPGATSARRQPALACPVSAPSRCWLRMWSRPVFCSRESRHFHIQKHCHRTASGSEASCRKGKCPSDGSWLQSTGWGNLQGGTELRGHTVNGETLSLRDADGQGCWMAWFCEKSRGGEDLSESGKTSAGGRAHPYLSERKKCKKYTLLVRIHSP